MVRTLCNNLPARWSMDLLYTDSVLFFMGFVHLYISVFSYFMGFTDANYSALSGTFLLYLCFSWRFFNLKIFLGGLVWLKALCSANLHWPIPIRLPWRAWLTHTLNPQGCAFGSVAICAEIISDVQSEEILKIKPYNGSLLFVAFACFWCKTKMFREIVKK